MLFKEIFWHSFVLQKAVKTTESAENICAHRHCWSKIQFRVLIVNTWFCSISLLNLAIVHQNKWWSLLHITGWTLLFQALVGLLQGLVEELVNLNFIYSLQNRWKHQLTAGGWHTAVMTWMLHSFQDYISFLHQEGFFTCIFAFHCLSLSPKLGNS